MPTNRIENSLLADLAALAEEGTLKGAESVIAGIVEPSAGKGPRYLLEGEGRREFLRMNANGYLGMARRKEVIAAGEKAAHAFGAGPGAVRFISGTCSPHIVLEERLARFHGRDAAMIFSSAYAAMLGVLPALITPETTVISDALNHNCIINAIRLARTGHTDVYPHLDLDVLETCLQKAVGHYRRVIIVTDGVFSMRGDYAPLDAIMAIATRHDAKFPENVIVVVDDSHGVGALGKTGRGTEEATGNACADLLVGTLGKAFGVNGGYVTGPRAIIDYLRQKAALYIYSNPVTAGEAAAATAAIDLLDGGEGRAILSHLLDMTHRFEAGLLALGLETITGDHPIVPLLIRDTEKTRTLVARLREKNILATGLTYPVVPRGEEEIRFQISADHTIADIDEALLAIAGQPGI
jgi:glycine C-acetyltransferase